MKILFYVLTIWFLLTSLIFGFSKSGLVFMLFDLGILIFYYQKALKISFFSMKNVSLLAILGGLPALITLQIISTKYGTSILELVVQRFLVTGGGTYGYFTLEGYKFFNNISFIEKLAYYFDTLLSSFRLKQWEEMSHMARMIYHLTGLNAPGFGANPYLFVDSHFLFGWFGILYCYFVGLLISFTRSLNINFIFFYIFVNMSMLMVADPAIAQAQIVAMSLFIPFIVFAYMLLYIYQSKWSFKLARLK
ncbi:hypothetical protein WDW89_18660 [Deltaproteobacteria bacterium TL4]